jgi:hypothetical protein
MTSLYQVRAGGQGTGQDHIVVRVGRDGSDFVRRGHNLAQGVKFFHRRKQKVSRKDAKSP